MTQPTSQEVKHTQQWKVNKIIYPAGQDVSFEVLDDAGDTVCQTIMREVIAEDERIAIDAQRANLFAAAPEMLSALKALRKRFSPGKGYTGIIGVGFDFTWEQVDAVILKAGGQ